MQTRETVACLALLAVILAPTAAADSVSENMTKLQAGVIETIAQWVPFLVMFSLLGAGLAGMGIGLIRR